MRACQSFKLMSLAAIAAYIGIAGCQTNSAVLPDGSKVYVVQKGDTLNSIAAANGTTLPELKSANKLANDRIRVGQRLVLPSLPFSFEKFMEKIAGRKEFETWVQSEEVQSLARKHPVGRDLSFSLPTKPEVLIAPLPSGDLIGKWQARYNACEREFFSNAPPKFYVSQAVETYDFKPDGKYAMTLEANGKTFQSAVGTWRYEGGRLTLTVENREIPYRVDWFGKTEMAIRCRDNAAGQRMVRGHMASRYPDSVYRNEVEFWYDKAGCQHIVRKHSGASRGVFAEAIETPHRYKKVIDAKAPDTAQANDNMELYQIVSCERESGSDFSYRFEIELADKRNLRTFRAVQQEFREAVKADYAESFPGVKLDSLYVDFPEYKLAEGKISGTAVVLTISVTSLSYDPSTRTGRLAVKVNANQ